MGVPIAVQEPIVDEFAHFVATHCSSASKHVYRTIFLNSLRMNLLLLDETDWLSVLVDA